MENGFPTLFSNIFLLFCECSQDLKELWSFRHGKQKFFLEIGFLFSFSIC